MIVQHDPARPNAAITIDAESPSRLAVAPFPYPGGQCQGNVLDLSAYQGEAFRLYLEADGSLSTELFRDHYWLLAEAVLPERRYEMVPSGQVDENGQPLTVLQEVPLDLGEIQITVFPLPEVG